MIIPRTKIELLDCVAQETARMSYPGSMSRGINPVVCGGTKELLEGYFVRKFPLIDIWGDSKTIANTYDDWHCRQVEAMGRAIKPNVCPGRNPKAVAAKFLNTFMHQLMKYEACQPLWRKLHLPLDSRVFNALRKGEFQSITAIKGDLRESPYNMSYVKYMKIQAELWYLVNELNLRPDADFEFTSRIELNWLWL